MDDDTRHILIERAFRALTDASEAIHDANSETGSPADRAEYARRAHELASYARELLAIVRENGKASE